MIYKEYSLLDLLSNIVDNRGRTCPVEEKGFPLIATNCIRNDSLHPVFDKVRYVSEEVYKNWFRGHPLPGDIIFVCKGSPGRVAWVPDPVPFCIAQDMVSIRADESKINPKYLFALLRSREVQKKIANMHVGTLIPHFKKGDFKNLYLSIPDDLDFQKKVGEAYFAFCQKIEINSKINQSLETISQTLFKSWFIDFEPVKIKMAVLEAGGTNDEAELAVTSAISGKDMVSLIRLQRQQPETFDDLVKMAALFPSTMQESEIGLLPSGWKVGQLSEIIDFNPKVTLSKGSIAPYLDMKNVPISGHLAEEVIEREVSSGTKFINGDTLLARITPCLENGKTAFVDFLEEGQVGWGSTEFIVLRSKEGYHPSLSYFIARNNTFRSAAIQSMTGTSGRQRANTNALTGIPWPIYPKKLIDIFGRITELFMESAKGNNQESKILVQIRDSLLPRLLSGEMKVENIDHFYRGEANG